MTAVFRCLIAGLLFFSAVSFLSCPAQLGQLGKASSFDINSIKSYRDIPGITEEEIKAIEALKASRTEFVYAAMLSTEAFVLPDGTYAGFSSMFCEELSELFGIPFTLQLRSWVGLKNGIDNRSIDFTGELTPTPERKQVYYMSHPIAERGLGVFTRDDVLQIKLDDLKGLKIGFYKGTITAESILAVYPDLIFQIVDVFDEQDVTEKLLSGAIDAFVSEATEALSYNKSFKMHNNIFPLIYTPVSMTTGNPELSPVITVIDKYITAGGIDKFYSFYRAGNLEYSKYNFYNSLTDAEKAYLDNLSAADGKVLMAFEGDNYPICFYNENDKEFQGIAPDVLVEISLLTGIQFENTTRKDDAWVQILEKLTLGEVSFVTELLFTEERKDRFLWPEYPYAVNRYALISKSDYPYLETYQVVRGTVGVMTKTGREDTYRALFPHANNLKTYDYQSEAFEALERGEVDLVMSTEYDFLTLTNYLEKTGYKINIVFNSPLVESFFGFNINEEILRSIINKSLSNIDTGRIERDWVTRTFNYERIMASQRSYYANLFLLIMAVFTLALLSLLAVLSGLLRKNVRVRKLYINEIEAKKQMEELITSENERLMLMLDTSPLCAQIWDRNLNTIDCNEAAVRLYGFKDKQEYREKFISSCSPEFQPDGQRSDEMAVKLVHQAFEEGSCKFDWMHQKPDDGAAIPAEVTLVRGKYGNNDVVIGYTRDLREYNKMLDAIKHREKMLENALNKMYEAIESAEESNRAKSIFLAQMSHEIRTPMNAILGISEIFLHGKGSSINAEEGFRKIYESGSLLLNIINDILDFSKIEAGKLDINSKKYDIPLLIDDTVQINRIRYENKQIEFTLQLDENTPLEVIGDELRIRQILNNLLSNAYKYTEMGKVGLSITFEMDQDDDEIVVLIFKVSDTGQGMSPDQLSRLFGEYERFNMETNQGISGTGLGMSITKRLVELMYGKILVKSEVGKGSVFTVYIPQKKCGSSVCGAETANNLQNFNFRSTTLLKKEQIIHEYMPHNRVLVVDDVESNLFVAKGLLIPYGLRVETAGGGLEAIEKIEKNEKYDIIFMDHMMPKMNGLEAVKIIRNMGYTHPIVALTANVIGGQEEKFLSNGFDGFLAKPIDSRELDLLLTHFIRDKASFSALQPLDDEETVRPRQNINERPEVKKYFAVDAENAVNVLSGLKTKLYELNDEEIEAYVIAAHGVKSALGNIGETTLRDTAFKLEQAGQQRNFAVMAEMTPAFIDALQALVDKYKTTETDSAVELSQEDKIFMQEKLNLIKTASEMFYKKDVKTALADLHEKKWPREINSMIEEISLNLLRGDFKKVISVAEQIEAAI